MCTGTEAIEGIGAAATIATTAYGAYSSATAKSGSPKLDATPAAPSSNDAAVGDAELKRKRAAASAFGRSSTIATSGAGVTGQPGVKLGYAAAGGA
jgi:hypothetical protein